MKNSFVLVIYTITFLLIGCKNNIEDKTEKTTTKEIKIKAPNNSVIQHNNTSKENIQEQYILDCKCELTSKYKYSFKPDLSFRKSSWKSHKINFLKLNKDSIVRNVKSLKLYGFDSIPSELLILKNIEHLYLNSSNGINGLDSFPKIKTIILWGADIVINENEKWIENIEYLRLEKTQIKKLSSIGLFKNLKQLDIFHSGFDGLTADFDKLKCLNRLSIRAYIGDTIILKNVDLKKMPCLKYLSIQDAYNTIIGIPSNVESSKLNYIHVGNIGMTENERIIIKKYKKSR